MHAGPAQRLTRREAHVLLSAESIVSDGDVDLRNQYRERAWRKWYRPTATDRPARWRRPDPRAARRRARRCCSRPPRRSAVSSASACSLAALAAIAFACAAALGRRMVPEPWATAAAVVVGLSAPVVAASTTVRPEIPCAAALAGAAVLALRVRDKPEAAVAFWAALLVAAVPWLGLTAVAPAIVVALALARWLRRRQRGLSGFVALEVVSFSAVVFVTINDRLLRRVDAIRVGRAARAGHRPARRERRARPRPAGFSS